MSVRIFVAILSVGLLTVASCDDWEGITDYKNPTLESFWTSFSLSDKRFGPYQVDGILVDLAWPHNDYQHYDASLTLVASSPGAEVDVLRLEVRNFGAMPLRAADEVFKIDRRIDGRALYRADRGIALMVDAESLAQAVAASGGKLEAILSVRVRQHGTSIEKDIAYSFDKKVRKYLPMR